MMTTITVELPHSLKKQIEALAAKEGYSVGQFVASAAGEKLAATITVERLRHEAEAGHRVDFERYLAAVPNDPPLESEQLD